MQHQPGQSGGDTGGGSAFEHSFGAIGSTNPSVLNSEPRAETYGAAYFVGCAGRPGGAELAVRCTGWTHLECGFAASGLIIYFVGFSGETS